MWYISQWLTVPEAQYGLIPGFSKGLLEIFLYPLKPWSWVNAQSSGVDLESVRAIQHGYELF